MNTLFYDLSIQNDDDAFILLLIDKNKKNWRRINHSQVFKLYKTKPYIINCYSFKKTFTASDINFGT